MPSASPPSAHAEFRGRDSLVRVAIALGALALLVVLRLVMTRPTATPALDPD